MFFLFVWVGLKENPRGRPYYTSMCVCVCCLLLTLFKVQRQTQRPPQQNGVPGLAHARWGACRRIREPPPQKKGGLVLVKTTPKGVSSFGPVGKPADFEDPLVKQQAACKHLLLGSSGWAIHVRPFNHRQKKSASCSQSDLPFPNGIVQTACFVEPSKMQSL